MKRPFISSLLFSAFALASGDVKVSIDGGALTNITTLPTVTPAAGKLVKVTLSQAEVNGDNITVVFSDAAGNEWTDDAGAVITDWELENYLHFF